MHASAELREARPRLSPLLADSYRGTGVIFFGDFDRPGVRSEADGGMRPRH